MLLKNKLKNDTVEAMKELKLARMDVRMVTGDNLLTSINCAYKCGLLK